MSDPEKYDGVLLNMATQLEGGVPEFQKDSKSKKYRGYSLDDLVEAYHACRDRKWSVLKASRLYGVPETTLRERVNGKIDIGVKRSGPAPVLDEEEECKLADYLNMLSTVGYGFSRFEVIEMATNYAISAGKRSPGESFTTQWYYNFLSRWPELEIKKAKGLSKQREKATSEKTLESYAYELYQVMKKYDLVDKPQYVYMLDEVGLNLEDKPSHSGRKTGSPEKVNRGTSTVTILGCGNAQGVVIPPYFVYASQQERPELLEGCVLGTGGSYSHTGLPDSDIIWTFIEQHILKNVEREGTLQPILLLYDGQRTHITLALVEFFQQLNVILFVLPAHTSHALKPLDVRCFGQFKDHFNTECQKFLKRQTKQTMSRNQVCVLASNAYVGALSSDYIARAFKKSGIYPLRPNAKCGRPVLQASMRLKEALQGTAGPRDKSSRSRALEKAIKREAEEFEKLESQVFRKSRTPVKRKRVQRKKASAEELETKEEKTTRRKKPHNRTKGMVKKGRAASASPSKSPMTVLLPGPSRAAKGSRQSAKQKRSVEPLVPETDDSSSEESDLETTDSDTLLKEPELELEMSVVKEEVVQTEIPTDEVEEEIPASELCCVCNKYHPDQAEDGYVVEFATWGKCDYEGCNHWTHLRYCCPVKVLRRHDQFHCPCHGLQWGVKPI